MGAAVITGVDAPPIFEPPEHVLDLVAVLVEDGVMWDRDLPVGFRRNAGGDAALERHVPTPSAGHSKIAPRASRSSAGSLRGRPDLDRQTVVSMC